MKRYKCFFLTGLIMFLSFLGYSQESVLKKLIDIEFQSITYKKILKEISKKTGSPFSYNSKLIPQKKKASISTTQMSLENVIKTLFKDMDIGFMEIDGIIILKTKKEIAQMKEQLKITENAPSTPPEIRKTEYSTLSGYIKDTQNGEILIGVNISIDSLNIGTVSNEYGYFSLTAPKGTHLIRYSYLGYDLSFKFVDMQDNISLDIDMITNEQMLEEITVNAIDYESIHTTLQMSNMDLSLNSLNNIPAYLGEADLLKHLEKIPGVKSFGDGSTAYYVRGGNKGQNLIILDDAPIFNPTHLFGFYSSFIPDAIKDIRIYKGNAPSKFGGRLSSVVDVRSKDGNMKQIEAGGSYGPFTTKFQFEAPIIKDYSSVLLAYRRSNINWLLSNDDPSLNFSDFNMKLNGRIKRNRFYMNFYRGMDSFEGLTTEYGYNGISWSNTALSLRWNYNINSKVFSNLTIFGSGYNYDLMMKDQNIEKWNSQINTVGLKNDISYYANPDNTLKFGLDAVSYNFNPGNIVYSDSATVTNAPVVSNAKLSSIAFYFSHEYSISKSLLFEYGFRIPYYSNAGESTVFSYDENKTITDTAFYMEGENYNGQFLFEPRINLVYVLNDYNSIKAAYTRNTQAIHLITNSESPFTSLDVWLPVSPNIKPQIANQYSIGYYHSFEKYPINFTSEIFYKKMQNQIDYAEHANMILNPQIEGELIFGEGWAYGIELLLKKDKGRLNGWLGYTISKAFRQFDDIQNGEPFAAPFDRLNDLVVYCSYKLKKRWLISGTWLYSSGAPYTEPTGFYENRGYTIPIYTEKNNERLPDYHRLDLMISFRLNKRDDIRYNHQITISIFNVYARKNPFNVTYNKAQKENGGYEIPTDHYNNRELVNTELYLMRMVPSINYIFKIK